MLQQFIITIICISIYHFFIKYQYKVQAFGYPFISINKYNMGIGWFIPHYSIWWSKSGSYTYWWSFSFKHKN